MKKLYILILLLSICINSVSDAQTTLISEDFESGYTHDTSIEGVNGWTLQDAGTMTVKTVNSSGNGYNSSNWYAEYTTGAFTIMQTEIAVEAGKTYTFSFYSYKTGTGATRVKVIDASATEILLGPTSGTADAWIERTGTFVAPKTETLKFQCVQNWGAGTIKIDDISVTCNDCTLSTEDNNAFEFSMYPNPVKDVIRFNSKEQIASAKAYSLLGKEVLNIKQPREYIDTAALNPGLYVLKLEAEDGGIVTKKFIKE